MTMTHQTGVISQLAVEIECPPLLSINQLKIIVINFKTEGNNGVSFKNRKRNHGQPF
jgi:hypothetical protein